MYILYICIIMCIYIYSIYIGIYHGTQKQWIQLSRKTPSEAFGSIKPMTTGIQWRYNRRYVRYGQNKRRLL